MGAELQKLITVTWTPVAQLTRIGEFNLVTKDFEECTSLDNTTDFKEFLATLMDTDEVEIEGDYDPIDATHVVFLTAANSLASEAWRLAFPYATEKVWEFTGTISKMTLGESTPGGRVTFSASLKRTSGALTIDPV